MTNVNVDDKAVHPAGEIESKTQTQQKSQELEHVGLSSSQKAPLDDDEEVEPKLHARTWVALAAFLLLNHVQLIAPYGLSAVLTYIGRDLNNTESQTWAVIVLSLVQAVLGPLISTTSDTFQARKLLLVGACAISFVGSCIAPGATTIYRLIGANILIGVGFASVPLAYSVPSEILPRRWRPLAQAAINLSALSAKLTGPFMIAALTKQNPHTGWRYFYWFQAALWGTTTLAIFFGYHPPKRHTGLEHLSIWKKFQQIDLIGSFLLTAGLTLFITGAALGGGLYAWTDAATLAPLISGLVVLLAFAIYEWKGTKTGIIHHDLFRGGKNKGRTFAICVGLLFTEAIMLNSFALFYPALTQTLFTADPVLIVGRLQACWVPSMFSSAVWGYVSTRYRTIREPLFVGFVLFTAGLVGLSTIEPGQSANAIAFSVLLGIGFSAPLILVLTGVQLSTPHSLLATATAITTSSRAIGSSVFSAVYTVCFNARLRNYLPNYVGGAALAAGLPAASVPAFIKALSSSNTAALAEIPGVSPAIIAEGVIALKQAFADALRIVFIIGVPFGVVSCIGCWFLGDLRDTMNYHVDAPVEKLEVKVENEKNTA